MLNLFLALTRQKLKQKKCTWTNWTWSSSKFWNKSGRRTGPVLSQVGAEPSVNPPQKSTRYLRCVKVERELVHEQHGDPQAAFRRSVRLLGRPNDTGQDQTLEMLYVHRILTSLRALYVRPGKLTPSRLSEASLFFGQIKLERSFASLFFQIKLERSFASLFYD